MIELQALAALDRLEQARKRAVARAKRLDSPLLPVVTSGLTLGWIARAAARRRAR